MRVFVEQV